MPSAAKGKTLPHTFGKIPRSQLKHSEKATEIKQEKMVEQSDN
jgi:hypothetical protein